MNTALIQRKRILVGLLLLAVLTVAGLAVLRQGSGPSSAPVDVLSLRFVDASAKAGIDGYVGQSYGSAWGDVDGNGWPDLWASGHSPERLFVNHGDGTFVDETQTRVKPLRGADRHGATWGDFDQDGDQDLLQSTGAGRGLGQGDNALYVNEGGMLTDRATDYAITYPKARARGGLWLDIDADQDLDLIMAAGPRMDAPPALFRFDDTGGTFKRSSLGFVQATASAQLAPLSGSATLHLLTGPPRTLHLHAITPQGFVAVAEEFNLRGLPGYAVSDVLIADFDNDLRFDIAWLRGRAAPGVEVVDGNRLLARLSVDEQRHRAEVSFVGPTALRIEVEPYGGAWWREKDVFIGAAAVAATALPVEISAAEAAVHGIGHGALGLFLGYDLGRERWRVELRGSRTNSANLRISGDAPIASVETSKLRRGEARLQQYLQWNGPKGFAPVTDAGLPEANCTGGAAGDFDNDMDVDLYLVCTGHLSNAPNRLLENLGNRTFREVPRAGGAAGSTAGLGESVSVADYDVDGRLDLFVRNGYELPPFGEGPDQLFRNLGPSGNWIELDLRGVRSNRDGIGALVMLTAGGQAQVRFAGSGVHGHVQDHMRLHFGLGENRRADHLLIRWPSGEETELRDLDGNRVWLIGEDGEDGEDGEAEVRLEAAGL